MNVNSLIVNTLKPIVSTVVPMNYSGTNNPYIVFNYADDRGTNFADDVPQNEQASLQIHLYTPKNYMTLKKQIRKALFDADFSYPVITEQYESDTELNHITFECDYVGGMEE